MELRSIELALSLNADGFDRARQSRVIHDDSGAFLAFGILWRGRYLGFLARSRGRRPLIADLLTWASAEADDGSPVVLTRSDDTECIALLHERGYSVQDTEMRMRHSLDSVLPDATIPDGFEVRPLDPQRELDAWLALYSAAIGDRPPALRKWAAYRAAPEYLRDIDLVAIDQRGNLAGACTCTVAPIEVDRCGVPEGRTEPVMVDERHRGIGLGRALVASGLHALARHGLRTAALTTEPENVAAHRFYETLGYRHVYDAQWYARPDTDASTSTRLGET